MRRLLKLFILLSIATLLACSDQNNNDSYAYLNASVQGSTASTGKTANKTTGVRQSKSNIPADVTKIDFIITDSEGETTTGSLSVGPQTDTISLRVLPHRGLNVTVNVYSGDTLSYQGQSVVAALYPGEVYPLKIEANPIGGPVLGFSASPASVIEGDSGSTTRMTFTLTLSGPANGNVNVDYITSDGSATGGAANGQGDYITSSGTLIIPPGDLTATLVVSVLGDDFNENIFPNIEIGTGSLILDEDFTLTLSNISANATLGTATATGTIIEDDYPERLNDTGMTNCGYTTSTGAAAYTVDCAGTGVTTSADGTISSPNITLTLPAGQDALYGRDSLSNDNSDGLAGFSFTKLDANGRPLADQTQNYVTQPWSCVMDNHTGLIWEVKTTDQGLHDNQSTYSWYNSTGMNDSGNLGTANGGTCSDTLNCDTEKFVVAVNTGNFCSTNNWRLPTAAELLSITNNNGDAINSQVLPFIDTNFFPNAVSFIGAGGDQSTEYWTFNSSADLLTNDSAWAVDLLNGKTKIVIKASPTTVVRLVSSGLLLPL